MQFVLRVDHIFQSDNVGVLQLLQKRDLPDGCAGNTLVLGIESVCPERQSEQGEDNFEKPYFFESNDFLGLLVASLVDNLEAKGAVNPT